MVVFNPDIDQVSRAGIGYRDFIAEHRSLRIASDAVGIVIELTVEGKAFQRHARLIARARNASNSFCYADASGRAGLQDAEPHAEAYGQGHLLELPSPWDEPRAAL